MVVTVVCEAGHVHEFNLAAFPEDLKRRVHERYSCLTCKGQALESSFVEGFL